MGKAAARCGDVANTCNDPSELPVGTVIATGMVLIDKLPAAKQTDKIIGVDTHIILIPTPGGPVPTPLPHPFNGMITTDCSTTVFIGGLPAATVDSVADNIPPHIPQGGPFQTPPTNKGKIIMGSPDVFIDNGGGGGAGGSGGATSSSATAQSAEVEEGHYLDVKVVDKGGKPIIGGSYKVKGPDNTEMSGPLTGQVKKSGVPEGSYEIELRAITKAAWSKSAARDGETVKLQVEAAGVDDGAPANFHIWQRDINKADREIAGFSDINVSGGKAEAEWAYEYPDDDHEDRQPHYSFPKFYFTVEIGDLQSRSGTLDYRDWLELELLDENGDALANEEFEVRFSTGEVRRGKTDGQGQARLEGVPTASHTVHFPGSGDVISEGAD